MGKSVGKPWLQRRRVRIAVQTMPDTLRRARIIDACGQLRGDPKPLLDLAQCQQTAGGQRFAVEVGQHRLAGDR